MVVHKSLLQGWSNLTFHRKVYELHPTNTKQLLDAVLRATANMACLHILGASESLTLVAGLGCVSQPLGATIGSMNHPEEGVRTFSHQ